MDIILLTISIVILNQLANHLLSRYREYQAGKALREYFQVSELSEALLKESDSFTSSKITSNRKLDS